MEFIYRHSELISMLSNVGVLLVWLVYAQLLYLNFSRQRKPKININQIHGYELGSSVCVISNLSQEPIQVECVLLVLLFSDHSLVYNVTEKQRNDGSQSWDNIHALTRQGALTSGSHVSLGRFCELLDHHSANEPCQMLSEENQIKAAGDIQGIEMRAIADYGPDRHPVGASRRFKLEQNDQGEWILYPESFYTQQVTGWRARYFAIPKWFDACTSKYFP